jgi:surface protein
MPFTPLTKDELKNEIGLYMIGISDYPVIGSWDVTRITNMDNLFNDKHTFNGDISRWTVTQVTSMSAMFRHAHNFNQDLSGWIVSNVTDMSFMFDNARNFNGNITNWDVSNVTDMSYMFDNAHKFNKPLHWDVRSVTNMGMMFRNTLIFNSPLTRPQSRGDGGWEVTGVLNMLMIFSDSMFNQNISDWNVNNVTTSPAHIFYHSQIDIANIPIRFRINIPGANRPIVYPGQVEPANALAQVQPARHEGRAFGIHNMFADIDKSALYAILGQPQEHIGNFRSVVDGHLRTFLPYVPAEDRSGLTAQFEVVSPCLAIVDTERVTKDTRTLINTALEYVRKQPEFFKRKYITSFVIDNVNAHHGVFDPTRPQSILSCSPGVAERIVTSIGPASVDAESEDISPELVDQYTALIKILSPVSVDQIGTFASNCRKETPSIDDANKDEMVRLYRKCIRDKLIEQGSISEGSPDPVVLTNYLVGIRNMVGGKRKTIKRLNRKRTHKMKLKKKSTCKNKNR